MSIFATSFRPALLLLGAIVALYWYRVIRMAAKARRRTGRAANLLPPEPLGRILRLLWGPAVIAWIALPIASAFVTKPSFLLRPLWRTSDADRSATAWVAVALVLACFTATHFCWKRMGKSWRMGIDPTEKTPLVATGAFAYVRHPIYSLSALMMLATAIALSSPMMVAAAAVHISLLWWESNREEQHLLRTHGAIYAHYRASAGRFIPISLRPYRGKT